MCAEKIFRRDDFDIELEFLETERLLLRSPSVSDAEQIASLADNQHVAEMLSTMPYPYTVADARTFLDQIGNRPVFAITDKSTNSLLGVIGLSKVTESQAELGYWLGEPHWGNGFATEAAHAVIDWGFNALNLDAISINCRVVNESSRKVIAKCGAQYTGTFLQKSRAIGGSVPTDRYRLDRTIWRGLKHWQGSAGHVRSVVTSATTQSLQTTQAD
jgi:RimJ/RimL family protein N-acetyltransferase